MLVDRCARAFTACRCSASQRIHRWTLPLGIVRCRFVSKTV